MEQWFLYFGTEFLGSLILIVLGNGVVANTILKGNKGYKTPFVMIVMGWGFAVAAGALVSSALGGVAHLNPAVTISFVVNGWTQNVGPWGLLPVIILGQALGFLAGQILVDLVYFEGIKSYFKSTSENFELSASKSVLAMHATVPQNKNVWSNFLMEFLGTVILLVVIFAIGKFSNPVLPKFFGPLMVMIVIMGIGCSLSGTTGYAINPFRDLAPRLVYQLLIFLPGANRLESADWKYAWLPVAAPMAAGVVVGGLFLI